MQLKDVTPVIKEILKERDKNPLAINTERYIPCYKPNQYGNAVRAGLRKSLRIIEQAPVVDAVPVVRCKDCKSFKEYTPEFKASNECVEGADGDCITRLLYSDAHPQFSAVRNSDYCSFGVKKDLEG